MRATAPFNAVPTPAIGRSGQPIFPLLLCVLVLDGAGCGAASDPLALVLGRGGRAITGGQLYDGHPAVGVLKLENGALCTATLVGERTLVTAAHCIKSDEFHFNLDSGEVIRATAWYAHPKFAGDNTPYDIAVFRLASAPAGVRPVAVAAKPVKVGMPIVLVGYGTTYCETLSDGSLSCTDDSGIKRRGENTIAEVSSIEFTFAGTASTCKGDSGGPAFATIDGHEVLVGVTSRGKMPCGNEGVDTRVDAFVDWIRAVAEGDVNTGLDPEVEIVEPRSGATLAPGTVKVKAKIADDSGTIVKAELLVDGKSAAPARTAPPFEFAVVLAVGDHELTVVATDPAGNTGDHTVTVSVVERPEPDAPEPAPGTFGADCAGPEDCSSGLCAEDDNAGRSYCTEACDPAGGPGSCPSAGECTSAGQADDYLCTLILEGPADHEAASDDHLLGSCRLPPADHRPPPPPATWLVLVVVLALSRLASPARRKD